MDQNILERILDGSMEPTDLPLETLRQITDNFSRNRIIGEGGFATVYKGVLQNRNVAVKKIMNSMTINEKLFHREVNSLMEVNHPNVVKFLGLCSHTVHTPMKNPDGPGYILAEKRERMLCFEYINNSSLDKHITDELRGLEWDIRYKVIKGICTGLYYLHMEKGILHMDLKPTNILLDNQMVPKITDFGLSRLVVNSQTTSSNHFVSLGYTAPENMSPHGRMSVKSDIYSLGVIIIEVVAGHKGIPDDKKNILRRWKHRWSKSAMKMPPSYQQEVTSCIEIGIQCQAIDPYRRPFISDIMNKFGEIESMDNHSTNADEPTIGQINLDTMEDDMLGVDPLELQFSNSKPHNKYVSSSCSVLLSNNTNGFIAFHIQTTSPLPYIIEPNMNIVPPKSKCSVGITLPTATHGQDKAVSQYHTRQYTERFTVRSIKVNHDLAAKDINEDMFDKGKSVDEVDLAVVSDAQLQTMSSILLSEEPCKEVNPFQAEFSRGMLLIVQPLELRFPFVPKMCMSCSLHLTNHTGEPVAFRLMRKNVGNSDYLDSLPLHGIVPPDSTYTLVLTTTEMEELPGETNIGLILQNSVADGDIKPFEDNGECDEFFEGVKETGDTLNELTLQAVCAPIEETTNQIIHMVQTATYMRCLDAHPTEPWIAIGLHTGVVQLWNYETQRIMCSVKVSEEEEEEVWSIKFVVRKQWLLAGDDDGYIHVLDYGAKLKNITTFRPASRGVASLAVHPTKPYVLSASSSCIYLSDWDNDWKCIQKFGGHSGFVRHVAFNPMNQDSFASASDDCTVKVWNIDSPQASYTLSGHSDEVNCLDFFTRDDQLYLISCSDDLTAKVWDMKEKTCVHTIEDFASEVAHVISLSDRPYLLTGSRDGLVHLWSSSDFRLVRTFAIAQKRYKWVEGLACLEGGRRFAVAHYSGQIIIMDIDDEESSC